MQFHLWICVCILNTKETTKKRIFNDDDVDVYDDNDKDMSVIADEFIVEFCFVGFFTYFLFSVHKQINLIFLIKIKQKNCK